MIFGKYIQITIFSTNSSQNRDLDPGDPRSQTISGSGSRIQIQIPDPNLDFRSKFYKIFS